jgi:acid phosphatase type 7
VSGNGGYHNLHKIHSQTGTVVQDTGAKLIYSNDTCWGYLTLTVSKKTISGKSTEDQRQIHGN